jgi:hypothetical protein
VTVAVTDLVKFLLKKIPRTSPIAKRGFVGFFVWYENRHSRVVRSLAWLPGSRMLKFRIIICSRGKPDEVPFGAF